MEKGGYSYLDDIGGKHNEDALHYMLRKQLHNPIASFKALAEAMKGINIEGVEVVSGQGKKVEYSGIMKRLEEMQKELSGRSAHSHRPRSKYYTLNENKEAKPCTRPEWEKMFEDLDKRKVAKNKIAQMEVSTMFIGMDSNIAGAHPLIFQTVILKLTDNSISYLLEYSTYEEAAAGHIRVCRSIINETLWEDFEHDNDR